jgi:hypothetical protein
LLSILPAAALLASVGVARADQAPMRHLVYKVDVAFNTTSTIHDSGIGGGPMSGHTDYHGGNMDDGQITLDVLQVQPDTGLVVRIAEQTRGNRNSVPTMCVVYGNGAVVCDQTKGGTTEEEMSLLRFAGRGFVNRSMIDAKNHWQYAQSSQGAQETNDYTISHDSSGVLDIDYQRVLKVTAPPAFDATTHGQLTYNEKMTVPTRIAEDTMTRKSTGGGNYEEDKQQITLVLSSDSMQTVQAH